MGCGASVSGNPNVAPLPISTIKEVEAFTPDEVSGWLLSLKVSKAAAQSATKNSVAGELVVSLWKSNGLNSLAAMLGLSKEELTAVASDLKRLSGSLAKSVSNADKRASAVMDAVMVAATAGGTVAVAGIAAMSNDKVLEKTEELVGAVLDKGRSLADGMHEVAGALGPAFSDVLSVLEGLSHVISHAPIVGAIGAALVVTLQLTRNALANSLACRRLAQRALQVGRLINKADALLQGPDTPGSRRVRDLFTKANPTMTELEDALAAANELIRKYSTKKWWRNVLSTGSDRQAFEDADRELMHAARALMDEVQMETTIMAVLDPFGSGGPSQEDQVQAAVLEKVRALRGSGTVLASDVAAYIAELEASGRREELLSLLSASDMALAQVIQQSIREDLKAIGSGVDKANEKLDSVILTQHDLLSRLNSLDGWRDGLKALSPQLREFWTSHIEGSSVAWRSFRRLIESSDARLEDRVRTLRNKRSEPEALMTEDFLEKVVRRRIDQDGNGMVSVTELHVFEVECQATAQRVQGLEFLPEDQPGTLGWCLSVVRQTFTASDLDPEMAEGLALLKKRLVPFDFTNEINEHVKNFVPGTKEWLHKEIDLWLSNVENRALAIVGSAGFGKSSFSSVLCTRRPDIIRGKLFFSSGESKTRSPQRMLRTLAYQLACSIPSLWGKVVEAAKGISSSADARTIFEKLLLEPLVALDEECCPTDSYVILLDAVDEAHEAGKPNVIGSLLIEYFSCLPPWIRVLLTTRPRSEEDAQVLNRCAEIFKCREISDSHPSHKKDLRLVIEHRLRPLVDGDPDLLRVGTENILKRAQDLVSFAYVHQLFKEVLGPKGRVTAADLELAALPECASSLYFGELKARISRHPELLEVLRVLVVAREAPLVYALAALLGRAVQDESFVGLLSHLTPFFVLPGSTLVEKRVEPYHKSVVEFLTTKERAGELYLDPAECERDLVDTLADMMRDLEAVPAANVLAFEAPCYFLRHTIPHAISTQRLDLADACASSMRFLRAKAELGAGALMDLRLELEYRRDALTPDLAVLLQFLTSLSQDEVEAVQDNPPLLVALVLERSPQESRLHRSAVNIKAEVEGLLKAHMESGAALPASMQSCHSKFGCGAWRASMNIVFNVPLPKDATEPIAYARPAVLAN